MIPTGLCRRVNTFFSQARNSLARERAAEREGWKGRETEKAKRERGGGDGNKTRLAWSEERTSFSHIISFPCRLFPLRKLFTPVASQSATSNTNTHANTHAAMSLKQIRPMAALHRGHVKSADCLNHISPALASV